MKKIIITATALFAFCASHAQSPTPNLKSSNKNIISFTPGNIIGSVFGGAYYNTTQVGEYLAQYRRVIGNANAIRIGFNATRTNSNSKQNDTISNSNNNLNTDFGIGYERYSYISKAWNFYYGADVQFGKGKRTNNNNNTPNSYYYTTSDNSLGGLLFLGVTVKLNNRLSFGIENGIKAGKTSSTGTSTQKYGTGGTVKTNTYSSEANYFNYVFPQFQVRINF